MMTTPLVDVENLPCISYEYTLKNSCQSRLDCYFLQNSSMVPLIEVMDHAQCDVLLLSNVYNCSLKKRGRKFVIKG